MILDALTYTILTIVVILTIAIYRLARSKEKDKNSIKLESHD